MICNNLQHTQAHNLTGTPIPLRNSEPQNSSFNFNQYNDDSMIQVQTTTSEQQGSTDQRIIPTTDIPLMPASNIESDLYFISIDVSVRDFKSQ